MSDRACQTEHVRPSIVRQSPTHMSRVWIAGRARMRGCASRRARPCTPPINSKPRAKRVLRRYAAWSLIGAAKIRIEAVKGRIGTANRRIEAVNRRIGAAKRQKGTDRAPSGPQRGASR
eukprot:142959-Rhodomonas_salina.1